MPHLLIDTCVWGGVVSQLISDGHDVIWTGSWPKDPGDSEILAEANRSQRILVTLDKDFGELAIVKGLPHSGIIRLAGFATREMAPAIHHIATSYQQELLDGAIITADPRKIRIRKAD